MHIPLQQRSSGGQSKFTQQIVQLGRRWAARRTSAVRSGRSKARSPDPVDDEESKILIKSREVTYVREFLDAFQFLTNPYAVPINKMKTPNNEMKNNVGSGG